MSGKRKRGPKEGANSQKDASKKARKDGDSSTAQPVQPAPKLKTIRFPETLTMDDRRREGEIYELLGSEDENDRLAAADCIISSLLEGDGVPETVLKRHLDRRLFRGLASGRNASRIGFSLVITEILSQLFGDKNLAEKRYNGLTFEDTLDFLADKTQPEGKVPGQEERDNYLGKLFGIECFVRAHILFKDDAKWELVLAMLLKLGYKKVWLRSQCGWVIVQALQQMEQKKMAITTLERIAAAGLAKTSEGVAMWLAALSRFPDLKVKPWTHPLHAKSLGDLTAVLKESFQHQGQDQGGQNHPPASNKRKTASWSAQLHYAWDFILAHYAGDRVSADSFELFWSRVVDGTSKS